MGLPCDERECMTGDYERGAGHGIWRLGLAQIDMNMGNLVYEGRADIFTTFLVLILGIGVKSSRLTGATSHNTEKD